MTKLNLASKWMHQAYPRLIPIFLFYATLLESNLKYSNKIYTTSSTCIFEFSLVVDQCFNSKIILFQNDFRKQGPKNT